MSSTLSQSRHIVKLLRSGRAVNVRNSLRRSFLPDDNVELLSTESPGILKWYSCGPTVYDDAHLGHARAYVTFDIMRRLLQERCNVDIEYALGVTDIDDKIINRARERNESPSKLAQRYETRFFEDMAALHVLPPTSILRVTEHVGDVCNFVEQLEKNGAAYAAPSGNVYFSVPSRGKRYAQLDPSRGIDATTTTTTISSEDEGEVEGYKKEKKDVRDFALWKSEEEGKLAWQSKWGNGRPGWHVECSAMAMRAFGDRLDVHTGGIDLRFPHHTNELATAEAAVGTCANTEENENGTDRWAHTWLHAGHLHISGRKMSKSLKNFVTIRSFLQSKQNDDDTNESDITGCASTFRLFCLAHRYAAPVELSPDRISDARAHLRRIRAFLTREGLVGALRNNTNNKNEDAYLTMNENIIKLIKPRSCDIAMHIAHAVNKLQSDVDDAVANDIDTPSLLRSILQCIDVANTAFPSSMPTLVPISGEAGLAYDTARHTISRILSDVGIANPMSDTLSTTDGKSDNNTQQNAIDLLVSFRADIRRAAREADKRKLFKLCDSAREQARSKFGIYIIDGKDGSSTWSKV